MPEHRALQVLKAARDILIAAQTYAGSNVEIGRVARIDEGGAIDIWLGPDTPINEFGTDNTQTIDSTLMVYVDLHARSPEHPELVLERIMQMRAETHAALLADYTLGLAFVISCRYQGAEDFSPDNVGDNVGALRTVWDIAYRMDYSDPAT